MIVTLSEALTHLAQTGTRWLERQMRGDSEEERLGFYNEEEQVVSHKTIQSVQQETRRLQKDLEDARQERREADHTHRDAINALLANYRALATEVDALKSPQPGTSRKMVTGFVHVGEAEDRRGLWKAIESLRPVTAHLQSEIVGLRDLVDAVAADQGNDRKAVEELYDNLADLGGPVEAIRTLMRDVIRMETVAEVQGDRLAQLEKNQPIGQDIPLDVRAVVRDATSNFDTRIGALTAHVAQLEERLAQAEHRNRGWQRTIDMILGRRPRG